MDFITHFLITSLLTLTRYFIIAGIPFIIFYVLFHRYFKRSKIQERKVPKHLLLYEILQSSQSALIFAAIGCLLIYTPISAYTSIYLDIHQHPWWWIPAVLIISMVLHDLYFYWLHRLIHHPRIFSYVHLVHHKSNNPSPWSSYSFHLLESIAEAMILPILIFILPMHPLSIFLFTFFSFLFNVYGHLGYEIVPRWFRKTPFFQIIGTSVYHNMHHAKFHYNYGLYFRIWDRLMGTEHPDYEKTFDTIQYRRFEHRTGRRLSKMAGLLGLFLIPGIGVSQDLSGYWKDPDSGAVVEIAQDENGVFSGLVISSGNVSDDRKLEGKQIYILREFTGAIEEAGLYRGTVFLPRRKLTLPATLRMESETTLIVDGRWGPIRHQMRWNRHYRNEQ
ncbi:MAG: sterol desaturase family protein [Saprospiraceae bacterium]|nr:sterol desaturase family protein [Saprospiraceae bacterium]